MIEIDRFDRQYYIPGQLVKEQRAHVEDMTAFSDLSSELTMAQKELNEFRKARNYESPCMQNPKAWDVRPSAWPGFPRESTKAYAVRVESSATRCLFCRAFVPCLKVKDAVNLESPEVTGVIAGELIDPSVMGQKVISARLQP